MEREREDRERYRWRTDKRLLFLRLLLSFLFLRHTGGANFWRRSVSEVTDNLIRDILERANATTTATTDDDDDEARKRTKAKDEDRRRRRNPSDDDDDHKF